jgi:hypothetical protein
MNHGKKNIPPHLLPEGYAEFLMDLKQRIKESQLKAAISANSALILLYWDIGKEIYARRRRQHHAGAPYSRSAKYHLILEGKFPAIILKQTRPDVHSPDSPDFPDVH